MTVGEAWVAAAGTAFTGSHLLMSHPLRRPLVGALGERAFLGVYSLVSFATLGLLVWAFLAAPATAPLWPVGDGLWAAASAGMLLASLLLVGSLVRNPALPTGGAPSAAPATAADVFAVTRHPMMWSVALWALCHVLIYPVAKNIVLAAFVGGLALAGSALQDRKKAQLQPESWPAWQSVTSFWPFAAVIAGRARLGGFRPHTWLGGTLLWLAATWAHIPLSGWPAGVWRWLR